MTTLTAPAAPRTKPAATRSGPRGCAVLRRLGRLTVSLVLATAVALFLALAVGPHLLDYRTATMLTGSMAPDIEAGDIVLTVPEPASQVQVGDVLSYHIPVGDHRVETHRVIEVLTASDGSPAIRTQGDANPGTDPWTATLDGDTVWQVKGSVPYVGDAIRLLRTPALGTTLLYGAPTVLVLWILAAIWGRPRDPAGQDA